MNSCVLKHLFEVFFLGDFLVAEPLVAELPLGESVATKKIAKTPRNALSDAILISNFQIFAAGTQKQMVY